METVGDEAARPEDLNRAEGTIGDDTDHPDGSLGPESGTPSDIESDGKEQN